MRKLHRRPDPFPVGTSQREPLYAQSSLAGADSVFCSVAFRLLTLISLILACGFSHADDLAMSAHGCRLSEMKSVVSRAAERRLRFAQLSAKAIGARIVFDYSLEPNTGDAWFAHFNLSGQKLGELEDDFAQQGFTRVIESEVLVRGSRRFTVVWQKVFPPRPLAIPSAVLPESGDNAPAFGEVSKAIRAFMTHHNVAGVTIAVGQGGHLLYSRAFGYSDVADRIPMSPDSEMRIASLSKIITATAIVKLIEQKRLQFDSLILPLLEANGFDLPAKTDDGWAQITVQHLLNHCGGWDSEHSDDPLFASSLISRKLKLRRNVTVNDVVAFQLRQPLDFVPGSQQVYSNFGYLILGRVIQQVTNLDYAEAVRELVLVPAGMESTRMGRSQLELRMNNEVVYHMQNTTCHRPFWGHSTRVVDTIVPHVDAPYGQWDLRVLGSAAGWVSTATDLVRLSSIADPTDQSERRLFKPVIAEDVAASRCWQLGWKVARESEHASVVREFSINGYLAGTSALLWRVDDVSCAVLFNTDDSIRGGCLSDWVRPIVREHVLPPVLEKLTSRGAVD